MKSQFTYNSRPMIRHRRSQFDLSRRHLTTVNMGDLVPIFWEEVLPGDTMKGHMKEVIRTTSPFIKPIMDNLFVDTFFFFVPNRLVMKDWQKVIGDDTGSSSWSIPDLKEVPSVSFDQTVSNGIAPQSLADYFGIPTGIESSQLSSVGDISSLLFRGYALIYNEWFRDENNEDPVLIQLGDASDPFADEKINNKPFSASNYLGMCAKVNKVHDRFTSALPAPQKGQSVSLGLFSSDATAPVKTFYGTNYGYSSTFIPLLNVEGPMDSTNGFWQSYIALNSDIGVDSGIPKEVTPTIMDYVSGKRYTYGSSKVVQPAAAGSKRRLFVDSSVSSSPTRTDDPVLSSVFAPANLRAEIGSVPVNFDINDLRLAFQTQKYLEKDARGGSRYIEFLREHFGVIAADARLQRPEYLGGHRTPIAIYQQNQTSAPTEDSPLGQVAGWSLTQSDSGFNKSFVEHGYIIGVACVRQFHTYQQGIHPSFFRHTRFDYYDPVFANIGEQPVYTRELYAGTGVTDGTVFGYQEAWSDYRQSTNRVSGYMRSSAPDTLDIWHLGDVYDNSPVLSQQFLEENSKNIDRVLSVPSSTTPNFLFDTYIDLKATRVMPTYSIPGLIDHH